MEYKHVIMIIPGLDCVSLDKVNSLIDMCTACCIVEDKCYFLFENCYERLKSVQHKFPANFVFF